MICSKSKDVGKGIPAHVDSWFYRPINSNKEDSAINNVSKNGSWNNVYCRTEKFVKINIHFAKNSLFILHISAIERSEEPTVNIAPNQMFDLSIFPCKAQCSGQ